MAYFKFTSLGVRYDDNKWIVQAELNQAITSSNMVSNGYSGYLAIAHRFNNLVPFVIYSRVKSKSELFNVNSNWGALGDSVMTLNAQAVGVINSTHMRQQTFSTGLRWNFNQNVY